MRAVAASLALIAGTHACLHAAYTPPVYELPPINYSHATPDDPVARLTKRISTGQIKATGSDRDILRTLLHALGVPESSQVLVFSKTSLESSLISTANPRAIYFSDSVFIGYVPGGLIEAIGIDPKLGPVFYALDPADVREGRRSFVREKSCLRCHGGNGSRDIPEVFMRSVITDAEGEVLSPHDGEVTTDSTPLDKRWGGWYVTGDTFFQEHMGNRVSTGTKAPARTAVPDFGSKYLTTSSDIVALLVLQHQLDAQNCLTRAGQRVRRELLANKVDERYVGELPARVQSVVDAESQDVLDHLLFLRSPPLPRGIKASDAFSADFSSSSSADSRSHSLRQLSLEGQLLRYRCSYMIDSDSFRGLPRILKQRIESRLQSELASTQSAERYSYLSSAERLSILNHLSEASGH